MSVFRYLIIAAASLLVCIVSTHAGLFSKSDTEKVQEAFAESLNKGKQRFLEQYHLLATAKELEVQKLVLFDAQGNATKNLKDATGFATVFTVFWDSPARSDGYLKMSAVYDFSIRNFSDLKVEATNGVLNEDAAKTAGEVLGAVFGAP